MALLFSGIGIPVYFLFVFAARPTFLFIHKRIWLDDVQQALARCFKRKPTYAGVEQFEYEKALLLWGRKYGGLTLMFHETYSNWYIVLVARTVLIANAPYLLRPADQEGQALILGSILLLFTCIHLYCFPYQAHSLNQFELCCLLCALAFVAQTFLSVSAGAITSVSFEDYANAALLLIVMGALIYFSILAANKKYIQNADVRMQVLRVLMFQSSCQAVPMVEIEDLKDYNYMYPQHYTNIILPRHTEALTDFSLAPAVTKNNGACKEHTADIPIVKSEHLGSAKSCPADALIACNHVQELYFAMSAGRPKSHSVYELFTQCVMKTGTPVTEPEKSDAVNKYVQKHPNVFRGIHMSDLAYCELMVQLYAANQNIRAPRSLKPVFVVALTIAACASAVTGFSWFGAVMAGTVLLGFLVQIWLIRASHRAVSSEVATFSAIVKAALLAAEEMSPVEAEAAIEFDVGFLWKAYSPPKLIQEKVWFFLTQPLRPNVPWMYFTVEVEEFKVEKKKSTKNAGSSQSKKKSTKRAAAKKKRKTAIAKKAARAAKKQQNLKKALAIMQKVTHLSAQKKSHKKNNMSAADLELDLLEEKAARAVIAEQNLVSESEKQAVQDLYLQHREAKLAVKANNMRPGKKRRDTLQLVQDALVGGNAPGPTEGLNIFEALEAEAEELRQLKSKLKGLSEPAVEANLPGQMHARDRAQEDLRSRSVMIRDVEGMMNPALLASYTQGQAGRKAKNKKTKGKPNMSKRSIMINQMNSSLMIQSSITE
jgi:hypothetical protein